MVGRPGSWASAARSPSGESCPLGRLGNLTTLAEPNPRNFTARVEVPWTSVEVITLIGRDPASPAADKNFRPGDVIVEAQNQPVKTPADLGVDTTPRLQVVKTAEPPKRSGGIKVKTTAELVGKLKEAGVL